MTKLRIHVFVPNKLLIRTIKNYFNATLLSDFDRNYCEP